MNALYAIAAWLCCAAGFIPRLLEDKPRKRPTSDRLIPAYEGEWPHWFHWFKNYGVEHVGADPQWWCKAMCFTTLIQAIVIVVLVLP
jgi:hypothetical protein